MSSTWAEAAEALLAGRVVLIPTDTVYGLAVIPTLPGATQQLFDLKGRGRDIPIAVLAADAAQAFGLAAQPVEGRALKLGLIHWPGALTLVVDRDPGWPGDIGDATSIGLRCPAHTEVRELCRAVGPLATTSANHHGSPTPVTSADAVAAFPGIDVVVDGGTLGGEASTVADCRVVPPRILRQGGVILR